MRSNYILKGKTPVPETDVIVWAEWFGTVDRTVVRTKLPSCEVSTVFLGVDHRWGDGPPLLFETLIFGGELDGEMWRYSTWEEAEAGHAKVVAMVKGEGEGEGKT